MTLTTVGYGDLHPTSAGTQLFTIFYVLTGIGVLVALLASVAQQYIRQKSEPGPVRGRLSAGRHRNPRTERRGLGGRHDETAPLSGRLRREDG